MRPGPLLIVDPAQVGTPHAEPRRALANPLPARGLDRRLPGGACGAARPGRTELVAFSDRPAKGGVAGRVRALARTRPLGAPLSLRLSRRRLPAGRMEEHAECMLVIIGATPEGAKELVGFQVGVRESAQSWRELLIEVKRRGLTRYPKRPQRASYQDAPRIAASSSKEKSGGDSTGGAGTPEMRIMLRPSNST